MAAKKLNSMRLLEANDIDYKVYTFDTSIHSAEGVSESVGIPPEHVYKTLVVMPDEPGRPQPMLVMISALRHLDLKSLAKVTGHKKMRMARHDEAEKLTKLQVGGISPLAVMAKNWDVYIDAHVEKLDWILLSAGERGMNLKVSVADLKQFLDLKVVDISTKE